MRRRVINANSTTEDVHTCVMAFRRKYCDMRKSKREKPCCKPSYLHTYAPDNYFYQKHIDKLNNNYRNRMFKYISNN